jgi:iron complex outermembrane receptor protein
MRYRMFVILAAIAYVHAYSQADLSGRVTDSDGRPLIGANVYIERTFRGSISDLDGKYTIAGLPAGRYSVKASYLGYGTVSQGVEIKGDTRLDFTLKQTSVMAEEVMVVATRAGNTSPVAHTDVSREEIEDRNMGQDIPVLLNLTPSMVTTSDAGNGVGYTAFRIRGTDMNRINVTVNGIPLNDSETHGVWWIDLPDFAASVDDVQIQRGVGTSSNGGSAFGATMNFQTFTMNPKPYGEFNTACGSFNTRRNSVTAGTGLLGDRFTLDIRLSKIGSD